MQKSATNFDRARDCMESDSEQFKVPSSGEHILPYPVLDKTLFEHFQSCVVSGHNLCCKHETVNKTSPDDGQDRPHLRYFSEYWHEFLLVTFFSPPVAGTSCRFGSV